MDWLSVLFASKCKWQIFHDFQPPCIPVLIGEVQVSQKKLPKNLPEPNKMYTFVAENKEIVSK